MSNNSQPKQQVSPGYNSLDGILGLVLGQFVIFIISTSQNRENSCRDEVGKTHSFFYSWIV